MKVLIGIDDTDNLESRGTGFRARELGRLLMKEGLAKLSGITRHQLLFDRRIPYTSHNSSACLEVETGNTDYLKGFCAEYLLRESAEGSDAGLCIAEETKVSETIVQWGLRAKKEIITQEEAVRIAALQDVFLEGYTGTKGGIIGSLAAVGLRKWGNDGRFLWVKGMREMTGVFTVDEIKKQTGIDAVLAVDYSLLEQETEIFLGDWWRPVIKNNKIIIFVERKNDGNDGWQIVSKDYIKSISN